MLSESDHDHALYLVPIDASPDRAWSSVTFSYAPAVANVRTLTCQSTRKGWFYPHDERG
jgi:hypothetical protein